MFFNLQLLVLKRFEFKEGGQVCPSDMGFQIIMAFLSKVVKIVLQHSYNAIGYRNLIVLKLLFSIKKKICLHLFFQNQAHFLKKTKLASVRGRFFRILLYDNFCSRLKITVP